jgi:hypothetical protein
LHRSALWLAKMEPSWSTPWWKMLGNEKWRPNEIQMSQRSRRWSHSRWWISTTVVISLEAGGCTMHCRGESEELHLFMSWVTPNRVNPIKE